MNPAAAGSGAVPSATPYLAVSRDADSTVWRRQSYAPGPNGTILTNSSGFVELGAGLNHLVNGQYVPSSDQVLLSPDASSAMATNAQHSVFFPGNIYSGFIKLVTPDGEVVQSRP